MIKKERGESRISNMEFSMWKGAEIRILMVASRIPSIRVSSTLGLACGGSPNFMII